MKSHTVYVILFFLGLNLISSKIDILKYNKIQTFSEEEEISSQLKNFEKKVVDHKYVKKLRNKGIQLEELKLILEKYADFKSFTKKPKILYPFRFREKNKYNNTTYNNDKLKNNQIHNSTLLSNITSEAKNKNINNILNDIPKKSLFENRLTKEEEEIQSINTRVKISPRNVVILNPDIFLKEPMTFFNYNLDDYTNLHRENSRACNQDWDYTLNGNDWMCTCQCGKNQSPIDILTEDAASQINRQLNTQNTTTNSSSSFLLSRENIYFDFKDEALACTEDEEEPCKYPLFKNTGKELIIQDDCGVIVLSSHNNGYKCFKMELHTPAEHKIDSQSFDLELQIYFRLENKHMMTGNTTDYLVVSILFNGVEEDRIPEGYTGIRNHPFLETFELDKIPQHKGQARML
jgi:hypothetical protein